MKDPAHWPDNESLASLLHKMHSRSVARAAVVLRPRIDRLTGIFLVAVGPTAIANYHGAVTEVFGERRPDTVPLDVHLTAETSLSELLEMMESTGNRLVSTELHYHGVPVSAWMLCGDDACRNFAEKLRTIGVSIAPADLEPVSAGEVEP